MSRRHQLIPGGCHTYSKGDANFPPGAPVLAGGKGGTVWQADGRPYVDWGMGINNVLIGHGEQVIDEAAWSAAHRGQAFCRPSVLEEEAAEAVLGLVGNGRDLMIKFAKSGSEANNAAIRLARAVTGRQHIAFDSTAPFFSTGDWFCHAQAKWQGTLDAEHAFAHGFRFNDVDSLVQVFAYRPLACIILEVCRFERPTPEFLTTLQELCRTHGTLLIVDEVVTGYRYGLPAAPLFDVEPDLFTLGKGMANGYSVAALVGKREYMRRGAEDVFLLSTTNGAESSGLAAAIATAMFYRGNDVTKHLALCGGALAKVVADAAREFHFSQLSIEGAFSARQRLTMPAAWRPTFHRTLLEHGVLWPYAWTCPCFRRTAEEFEITRRALIEACRAVIPVIHGKVPA